jgi:hypothetical protein
MWGLAAATLLVIPLACGGGDDSGPQIVTSQQDLCAGAAPVYAGGYATSAACPFVQHADNVAQFGDKLPNATSLHDGSGAVVATVTHTCDAWALGTDAQGITVIVDRSSGRVVSHGNLHPGQPTSQLVSPLAQPVTLR